MLVIPKIITLISDTEAASVRKLGAGALLRLSEQGKTSTFLAWTPLMYS
jgi:hypothetical protein